MKKIPAHCLGKINESRTSSLNTNKNKQGNNLYIFFKNERKQQNERKIVYVYLFLFSLIMYQAVVMFLKVLIWILELSLQRLV